MVVRVKFYFHFEAHIEVKDVEGSMCKGARQVFKYIFELSMHHLLLEEMALCKDMEKLLLTGSYLLQ